MNAESGFATCDANGCGTYLRASKFPFENAIEDVTQRPEVREREFAVLDAPRPRQPAASPAGRAAPSVDKLADGFYSISGGAVDAEGKLYFVDRHFQRIHGWSASAGSTMARDARSIRSTSRSTRRAI